MIKGITPRLAEGGKIKIGGLGETRTSASGKQWRVPKKQDYFTVTKTIRNVAGDLEPDVQLMEALAAQGFADPDGRIRRLPIILHSDEIDEVFPTCYARYSGKARNCFGDGYSATQYEIKEGTPTGVTRERNCPCAELEAQRCKSHATLHCSIALPGYAVAGAVHRWRTCSRISIEQMIGSFLQIKQSVGVIRNVPLQMVVRPMTVSPEGRTTTIYVCHVELRAQDVLGLQRQLLESAKMRHEVMAELDAIQRASYRALIQAPAAEVESYDESADVQQEFHPEPEAQAGGLQSGNFGFGRNSKPIPIAPEVVQEQLAEAAQNAVTHTTEAPEDIPPTVAEHTTVTDDSPKKRGRPPKKVEPIDDDDLAF